MSGFSHQQSQDGAPVTIFFEEITDTPEQQEAFRKEDEAIKHLNKTMAGEQGEDEEDNEEENLGTNIQEIDLTSGGVVQKGDLKKKKRKKKKKKKTSGTCVCPLTACSECVSTQASFAHGPRGGATLTLNGRGGTLTLLGGADRNGQHFAVDATMEFDLKSREWASGGGGGEGGGSGSGPCPRSGHSAVYEEGRETLYLFGGISPTPDDPGLAMFHSDLWKLKAGEWTKVAVEGGPSARHEHRACVVATEAGKFMCVFGGVDEGRTYDELWMFDLERESWELLKVEKGEKPQSREMHCMTAGGSGGGSGTFSSLYVTGGRHTETGEVLKDLWVFDFKSMGWTRLGNPPSKRCSHGGGLMLDEGYLVLFGGFDGGEVMYDDFIVYDIAGESGWSEMEVEAAPVIRFSLASCVVVGEGGEGEGEREETEMGKGKGKELVLFGGVNPFNDLADVHVVSVELSLEGGEEGEEGGEGN
ncbi:hypothetical protein TrVE_jg724 [Triparma verrucosa]|uniref:Kelch repeat-containing protein n=1 Tax=Triparma verrucosa TaxID=1606542 RepID=A0A9W7F6Z9_9STRA|nr:hypothetical protein TrVE_jg724 [Triparma verrucosa]